MAFFGKFNAFLASIPMPVMGGIMLLLFGTIASLGIKTLIDAKVDLMQPKNLVIVSSVLTTGIGGMIIKVGTLSFAGVGLCADGHYPELRFAQYQIRRSINSWLINSKAV